MAKPDLKPASTRKTPSDSEAREEFRVTVIALDRRCVAAREDSPCDGELHAHHVIEQQRLRRLGLVAYLWDPSIGAAVCERHHRRHHSGRERIPLAALPRRVLVLVERLGLSDLLRRSYA